MEKVLLHICCGPCASYPIEALREEEYELMGYFGNPNIHPYTEYLKRRRSVERLADVKKIKVIYEDDYNPVYYFNTIAFRESKRCFLCYQMRLEKAAHIAKKGKFDYFTTSLLVSKRQKHDLIKQAGEYTGHKYGIPFLYKDFRTGYEKSRELAREMDLYRQQYCGCLYSEYERWTGKPAVVSKL
ncbi:MAG: epoxyqueuosine reductase QueH [Syntrophomonadaceae bacterium]|nr:epoxyqueuosine reductase QueH [Syntrophomonadaceae bacterium]